MAIRYQKGDPIIIRYDDFAAIGKDGYGAVMPMFDILRDAIGTKNQFPLNYGAGMMVRNGDWIVALPDAGIAIMTDDAFRFFFVQKEG